VTTTIPLGRWDEVRDGAHDPLRTAVHDSRSALIALGGAFMRSPQIADAARPLALSPRALYFQGRSGALGQLTPVSVTRLFGTFAPRAVEASLGGREPLVPPQTAATTFARAAAAWGEAHLGGVPDDDLGRLAASAEAVVDRTPADALPLVAAWRAQPRPAPQRARAAHAAFLLREMRGALYFASLALHGLPVVQAVLADPDAGPDRLRAFGFTAEEVADAQAEMTPAERHERRVAAEHDTDDALAARMLAALGADDALALTGLVRQAAETAGLV
jgi:hypothetical protein